MSKSIINQLRKALPVGWEYYYSYRWASGPTLYNNYYELRLEAHWPQFVDWNTDTRGPLYRNAYLFLLYKGEGSAHNKKVVCYSNKLEDIVGLLEGIHAVTS